LQDGHSFRSPRLRIGYFAQHQTDELTLTETPFQHMAALMRQAPPSKVRAQLGRFGFSQERADVKVASLSGGEKARLLFALMSRDAPHLMILDEPTNHLDIDSREALVTALNAYQGAVVLISHDPRLIELTADRLLLVANGGVTDFDGDMADYKALLLQDAALARRSTRNDRKKSKQGRRADGEQRPQLAPLRRQTADAERHVETLTLRKTQLESELADPQIYGGPAEAITARRRALADLERDLAIAEAAWLAAQEALERAE